MVESDKEPNVQPSGRPLLGELRAELAVAQARAAQLRRELSRNELATAGAVEKFEEAAARVSELELKIQQTEADRQTLRARLAALESSQEELRLQIGDRIGEIEALKAKLAATQAAAPTLDPADGGGAPRLLARLPGWLKGDRSFSGARHIPSLSEQRSAIERSGMFDPDWYHSRYTDIGSTKLDPIDHFLKLGWREGKDPAPGFSTGFYLEANADVRSSGLNPLYHYIVIGRYQGRPPSEDAKYVEGIDQIAVIADEFDDEFYRAKSGQPLARPQALEHFLRRGWKEGLDPHPQFSTQHYLKANPDVWRTGINPYVHYILTGRREGRLPREFPALSDELLDQWRTIAREFDVRFYRSRYVEVVEGRFEPILHYLLEGWRREYDPHPQFSTSHYLDDNPDVRHAGINPYVHYLAEGRREGRSPRVAGSWTARAELQRVVAAEFDEAFYLARNPDVAEVGADPLQHFLDYGWKEGRDPNPDFATRFYLESNTDVVAAGVNPFYHYLVAGRAEGRDAVHPGGWRALALHRLRPLDKQIEDAIENAPASGDILDCEALAAALATHGLQRVFVTLSQDDYTTSVGGVQLCLKLEEQQARARRITHVNLHPALPIGVLSRDTTGDDTLLVITCNGERLGAAWASELLLAFSMLAAEIKQSFLVAHSLLGHSPEAVANLHATIQPERSFLWLHDFFSICPSYTLLRNNITHCHAPEMGSSACRLCVFGEERQGHLDRMTRLFASVPFELVAPSRFAAEFWRSKSNLPAAKIHVQEHCRLEEAGTAPAAAADGPVRVAFLGHPSSHKGWQTYLRVLRDVGQDQRYEFHHFGVGSKCDRRTKFTRASVLDDGPHAMIDALREQRIDAVVLWSIWPETFSFVVHEAICAGASVLTSTDSGNIAAIVRRRGCGAVLSDEAALIAAFRNGVVAEMSLAARRDPKAPLAPVFSAMTFGVLDGTSPP